MEKKGIGVFILLIFIVTLFSGVAYAKNMKLLAVSKTKGGLTGTDADLELEVKPGSGRVFISTFPLTNVDTQISFRMAKEFACDFLDRDCSNYDFYYVIRSSAPIIGGPSAGGAATALTISVLDNLEIDKNVAVTGTINSGGIIGPVAGIKEKIEAAKKIGIKKVMIPDGTRFYDEEKNLPTEEGPVNNSTQAPNITIGKFNGNNSNNTLDLVKYGQGLGIDVTEVSDIYDVIAGLTGKKYKTFDENVGIDSTYARIMGDISHKLCNRTQKLLNEIDTGTLDKYKAAVEAGYNLTQNAEQADKEGYAYAAASYCYGANVKYQYLYLLSLNMTLGDIEVLQNQTLEKIYIQEKLTKQVKYKTITDMQTYLVVEERLTEAKDYIQKSVEEYNTSEDKLYQLALAIERLNSAKYWSEFFGQPGQMFDLTKVELDRFCLDKVSEADERLQYLLSVIPVLPMTALRNDLDSAMQEYGNGSGAMCIFKASKVKARTNMILNSIGIPDEDFKKLLTKKIELTRRTIVKETKRGVFPILGYSYYEYGKSLEEIDPGSAMLYTELALELSNFDMYFKSAKPSIQNFDFFPYALFIGGALTGFILGALVFMKGREPAKNIEPGQKSPNKARSNPVSRPIKKRK